MTLIDSLSNVIRQPVSLLVLLTCFIYNGTAFLKEDRWSQDDQLVVYEQLFQVSLNRCLVLKLGDSCYSRWRFLFCEWVLLLRFSFC